MSSQYFLNEEDFLTIIQQEVPQGLYPVDRADDIDPNKRSVSSSELRALARLLAQASQNLSDINADKFLSTVQEDALVLWEQNLFSSAQDSSQPLEVRRQALISKLRSTAGLSYSAIKSVIAGVLGDGVAFDLLPIAGANGGAWIFDVSLLGVNTYLGIQDPLIGARTENGLVPLDCSQNYAAAGLTQAQFLAIQQFYNYDVRIYSNVSQAVLNLLDKTLSTIEPARSSHNILNNYPLPSIDYTSYVAATPDFARFRI